MKGIHTRAPAHIFILKAGGCFTGTLLQGKILERTTRWGIGDMRHKSSDTSGRVTETGALPPRPVKYQRQGRQRDTWTVMLAPCQSGCQEVRREGGAGGDSDGTNTHDGSGATICASQRPVNQPLSIPE